MLREGTDVTIVATLLMVERSLAAAEALAAEGISAEVIDLRWIRPIDHATIEASVRKTGRLVIAEEQWHEGGWGATIISKLAQTRIPWKASPTAVSLPYDLLIPYSPTLEDGDHAVSRTGSPPPHGPWSVDDHARGGSCGARRGRPSRHSTAARCASSASRPSRSGRPSRAGSSAAPTR